MIASPSFTRFVQIIAILCVCDKQNARCSNCPDKNRSALVFIIPINGIFNACSIAGHTETTECTFHGNGW